MQRTARVRYRWPARIVSFLANERALPWLFVSFIAMIFVFGVLYWLLTPFNHGIKEGSGIPPDFSILDGLYFSVVTISSLGYGDLRPVGLSRALASLEVIIGLSLIGIMIAALTSRRISHLVSRLFVSDARRRLKEFTTSFDRSEQHFLDLLNRFSRAYEVTPKSKGIDDNMTELALKFRDSLRTLMASSTDLRDYLKDEAGEAHYFELAPPPAILETSSAISEAFFVLSQCIISLPTASRPEVLSNILNKANRQVIMQSVEMQREVCKIGIDNAKNHEIRQSFEELLNVCESVSNCFFQTPTEEQPDQVAYSSNTPQD